MSLILKKTHCFSCKDGSMTRDTSDHNYYKYVCDTCGAYSQGLMSGYSGTQLYNKDGSRRLDYDGRKVDWKKLGEFNNDF